MWCAVDNRSYMYHIRSKEISDSTFNQTVTATISTFHEIALNFTYLQKSEF